MITSHRHPSNHARQMVAADLVVVGVGVVVGVMGLAAGLGLS